MHATRNLPSPKKQQLLFTIIRITVLFILSFYLVTAGQQLSVTELINYPGFYVAVGFSFALMVVVVYLAKWINAKLNKHCNWRSMPIKRLIFQLLLCFLLMLLVVYLIMRLYFYLGKGDFNGSGYMQVEFQIVKWMLLALNFKLLLIEMWPSYFQKPSTIDSECQEVEANTNELIPDLQEQDFKDHFYTELKTEPEQVYNKPFDCFDDTGVKCDKKTVPGIIDTLLPETELNIAPKINPNPDIECVYVQIIECNINVNKLVFLDITEVTCFKREGNVGYVWNKNNSKYNMSYKMSDLRNMLDPKLFIQISRSEIFALAVIKGLDKNSAHLLLHDAISIGATGKISEGRLKRTMSILEGHL